MAKQIPDNSPLIGGELICHGCGNVMQSKIFFKPNHTVDYLLYQCINEKVGCRYEIRSTVMIQAEMTGIRQDGTQVSLPR